LGRNPLNKETTMIEKLMAVLPKGKDNAILASEIAEKLGLKREKTEQPTRELISEAITKHHKVIGSCQKGFYVPQTKSEFHSIVDSLESRRSALNARIDSLWESWVSQVGDV
jgi:biotin operon repressor